MHSFTRKTWLFSKPIDLWVVGLPVWLCWVACFLVSDSILNQDVPLWFWVVIIVGIDVSHVWSTIFRTYLDKEEFQHHKNTLLRVPIVSFILLFFLSWYSITLFWTILAYLALYHFVKQQYGFMQLYRARYGSTPFQKRISDKFAIYLGTLYPVVYWHINSTRSFNWFVQGDFFNVNSFIINNQILGIPVLEIINYIGTSLYFLLLIAWLAEELMLTKKHQLKVHFGKIIWVLTTALNWYLGIVHFNSDFVFSLTNVVAHGIPYMALLFFYVEQKKKIITPNRPITKVVSNIVFMIIIVLFLAFGEEYFWDMLLYRDNEDFFQSLFTYPINVLKSPFAQAFGFALLTLPQVTHYILDGVIWKKNKKNPYLGEIIMH